MVGSRFFDERVDGNGRLLSIEPHWPDNFNFGYDIVDVIARESPEKTALVWCNTDGEEHIFTFADMRDQSNRAANALLKSGIKKGDRVMLCLKRHHEYWFTAVALHKIGAVMIPVTHMLTTDDFIYRFKSANVRAIICTPFDKVPQKVKKAAEAVGTDIKLWTVKKNIEGFEDFSEACFRASDKLERIPTSAEDHMVLYFTSGTSGYPKGVIHDYAYPLVHYITSRYWQQTEENGLHFTISETGWAKASWGKLYGQWLTGSAIMVYDFDNFEPRQMASVINRHHVTSFCAPSTVYRYMTRKNAFLKPSFSHAATVGEFLSLEVFDRFREQTGFTIMEGFGQTETGLLIGNLKGMVPKDGSLGMPSPLYDIRLLGRDGSEVPVGEIGEICVAPREGKRPLGILCAYLDNDELYKNVWRGGVYHTGDAAWRDEDGYYWFHGRFDDIIKSGGFRVGPYEIESELIKNPAVMECSVIGVPDKMRGQAIKAVIVLAPGYEPTHEMEKQIRETCNRELAEYKWVRIIEFVEEMPKTISGKIRKSKLREDNIRKIPDSGRRKNWGKNQGVS